MKAQITLLLLLPILLISCCRRPATEKGLLKTLCDNNIDGLDMLQFYVHPAQFEDLKQNFNSIFYTDTSILNPVKLGPHSEDIPINELRNLINFNLGKCNNCKKGLRLLYGYDTAANKKMFIMYQPVRLMNEHEVIHEGFSYANFNAEFIVDNQYYVYKWNDRWDTLNQEQFNMYSTQYANAVKVKKHDNHFRMLNIIPDNPASDAGGITFPVAEIDTLISHHEKFLNAAKIMTSPEGIKFSSGAKNIPQNPWEYHYKHIILMSAVVGSAPTQHLTFTGAAANMGSLCPPNCLDNIEFLKATGCK